MDFLDPEKQKQHTRRLALGYALMGVMLVMATIILLYHAYGYGVDKQGHVIQSGFVFISSHPSGADIYVNDKKYKSGTTARLNLPSGQYVMKLRRDGYREWKRVMTVEGGGVERFSYPLLFPTSLTTSLVKQYAAAPVFSTQSPDQQWLLVAGQAPNTFDVFDLDIHQLVPRLLTVPAEIMAAGSNTTGWQLVEWSKDSRHVVLKRSYQTAGQPGVEYILLDREAPELSQNLTVLFGFSPTTIELRDQAYDKYYLYDQASSQLFTASLKEPTPQVYVSGVLAFSSRKDFVAYATALEAPAGKVLIRVKQGDHPAVTIRQVSAGTAYLLDVGLYGGDLYVAAGAVSENRAFVFRDPFGQLKSKPNEPLTPVQILKVASPSYISFSAEDRIVALQNGNTFAVYDAETDRGYAYQSPVPMDAPQLHATWMDEFHLSYVGGGKVVVFDFDGANLQTLSAAVPGHAPFFDSTYKNLYTLDSQNRLNATSLLTPKDL